MSDLAISGMALDQIGLVPSKLCCNARAVCANQSRLSKPWKSCNSERNQTQANSHFLQSQFVSILGHGSFEQLGQGDGQQGSGFLRLRHLDKKKQKHTHGMASHGHLAGFYQVHTGYPCALMLDLAEFQVLLKARRDF